MSYIAFGDCFDLFAGVESQSIDMVLADLPYGVTNNPEDIPLDLGRLWVEYKRVLKPGGVVLLFGQGKFYVDLVNSNRSWFKYDLVWDKVLTTGFLNSKRMPLRQHEQIAVFYKKAPVYHPQFTTGKPLHGKGRKYKTAKIKNQNYGAFHATEDIRKGSTEKYPTSILRFPKPHPSIALHRNEKPVALLEWLIKTYTDPGAVVLDNCMGAGGTCVAALLSGREYIGFEKNEEYYEIAKRRLTGGYS